MIISNFHKYFPSFIKFAFHKITKQAQVHDSELEIKEIINKPVSISLQAKHSNYLISIKILFQYFHQSFIILPSNNLCLNDDNL